MSNKTTTQNIEKIIDSGRVDSIPVEAITEARNALADEYIKKLETLEKADLMTRLHNKRITERILQIEKHLSRLDAWIKGIKK